jgi:RNA polymerase sigma factor (sigma-70 family)
VTVTAGEPGLASGHAAPDDPAGFGAWVRPHLRSVSNLVARLAPAADRDDVVQDVLARAWVKRRQFDARRGTPAAWLLAIAADQAGKARRRARPVSPLGDEEDTAPGADAAAGRVDVERALHRLTRRQRLAVECVYFVGLTVAETAAVMGCAEGTVKSTLADARARLRTLLEVAE